MCSLLQLDLLYFLTFNTEMDLATLELIVFCVITFYKGVTSRIIFIDSCRTVLEFTNHDSSFTLTYDGDFLTEPYGYPCVAFVEISHVEDTTVNICVKLNPGYGTCKQFFKFYYAEDFVNIYKYCEQIQYQAVCQKSDAVFIEFQPWNKTEYSEDVKIDVYEEEYSDESGATLLAGIIIGLIAIGMVMVSAAAVRQHVCSRDDRGQTVNQPRAQLTRYNSRDDSQEHQSPDNSAGPPQYADVMAAENRENNVSITHNRETLENESQNRQCLQEDTLNLSAPPLRGDIVPDEPPSLPDDTIPEEPPPPYPGY
ncbi:uncharacterized protein LOC128547928 [Mercenaria mercenaria]|uniref:uncharacterized protein LOC128547928 n=1 Tax=Mercenaria mercenaria TaxID=6596 RepID=UPI00234E6AC6|nr:uncharacterized protein LOC128547928 [Mercenaria mercenaria]